MVINAEIYGDPNLSNLKSLQKCYFNPNHYIGLKVNEVTKLFTRDSSLCETSKEIISIDISVKGLPLMKMNVKENQVSDFIFLK